MRRFVMALTMVIALGALGGCAGFDKLGSLFAGKTNNLVEDKEFKGDPSFGMEPAPENLPVKEAKEIATKPGIIFLEMHHGKTSRDITTASGVMISYGGRPHILSAAHITDGPRYIKIYAYFSEKRKRPEEVEIIAISKNLDIALLRFTDANFQYNEPYASFADSSDLKIGDKVIALGHPYGFGLTVSEGIVSTLEVGINYEGIAQPQWLMHWANLNPGNSGGPLFDNRGRLVGVNNKGFGMGGKSNDSPMQVATPINDVKIFLRGLKKSGEFETPLSGILNIPHTGELNDLNFEEKEIKRPDRDGWMVYKLLEDGQAEKAGLKVGDIILEFDGRIPKSYMDTARYIMFERVAGDEISFRVYRFGEEKTIKVKLESREDYEKRQGEKYREKLRRNR